MDELTDREKLLMDGIKKLITVASIDSIYTNRVIELIKWRHDALESIGVTMKWQDEFLHSLEAEFGIQYTKVKDNGEPLEEDDGDQT